MAEVDLFFGPYIGDFKQEIMTFRPYITWLTEQIPHKSLFVSTHYNRSFLYDCHNIEIDRELSVDEHNQKNYIHKTIDKATYSQIQKVTKEQIINNSTATRKSLKNYTLAYVQFTQPYSIYQKTFNKIENFDDDDVYTEDVSDYIVVIPEESGNYLQTEYMINELSKKYKVLVIGDKKIHFSDANMLSKKADYADNVYKYLLKYIESCRCVVCPVSHWTFLCNLQGVPVYSWGEAISLYKLGGDYHFNNNNMVLYADEKTKKETILSQFEWFNENKI